MKVDLEARNVAWRRGFRAKIPAEDADTELERLRKKHGYIDPSIVVSAAKSKRNKLHKQFEWDDGIAADGFRQQQARQMMASLMIVDVPADPETKAKAKTHRAIETQTITPKGESKPRRIYNSVEDIMDDPDARAELLQRALNELCSFRNRYKTLQELAIVHRSIEEVLETAEL